MPIDEKALEEANRIYWAEWVKHPNNAFQQSEALRQAIIAYEAAKAIGDNLSPTEQPVELSPADYTKFKAEFSAKYHIEPDGHQVAWGWSGYHYAKTTKRESVGLKDIIESAFREGFALGGDPMGVSEDEFWHHSQARAGIPPLRPVDDEQGRHESITDIAKKRGAVKNPQAQLEEILREERNRNDIEDDSSSPDYRGCHKEPNA